MIMDRTKVIPKIAVKPTDIPDPCNIHYFITAPSGNVNVMNALRQGLHFAPTTHGASCRDERARTNGPSTDVPIVS
jgi:hypothetical protein